MSSAPLIHVQFPTRSEVLRCLKQIANYMVDNSEEAQWLRADFYREMLDGKEGAKEHLINQITIRESLESAWSGIRDHKRVYNYDQDEEIVPFRGSCAVMTNLHNNPIGIYFAQHLAREYRGSMIFVYIDVKDNVKGVGLAVVQFADSFVVACKWLNECWTNEIEFTIGVAGIHLEPIPRSHGSDTVESTLAFDSRTIDWENNDIFKRRPRTEQLFRALRFVVNLSPYTVGFGWRPLDICLRVVILVIWSVSSCLWLWTTYTVYSLAVSLNFPKSPLTLCVGLFRFAKNGFRTLMPWRMTCCFFMMVAPRLRLLERSSFRARPLMRVINILNQFSIPMSLSRGSLIIFAIFLRRMTGR